LNGNVVWNKDVGTFPMQFGWGTGSSPTLDDARIFVQCDNEKESFLVALDKKNGKEIWRKKRDGKSGWSTPYLWKNDSRTELVCIGSTKAESYDPATGEVIWVINELDAGPISSPVSTSKMLYFGSSNPFRGKSPLIAIKAGAKGDITLKTSETKNSGIAWMKTGAAPGYASPILVDDKLYVIAQRGGVFSCYDGATGDRLFQERLPGAGGFTSSPWSAGGRIYCTDENGKTFVLQAGSTFKLIGTNSVEDMFWSSPAIGDRTIVLRGRDKIYAIR
jgi:outer membrane protein assembly factor BamB